MIIRTLAIGALLVVGTVGIASAQDKAAMQAAQKACMPDAKALCSGVAPGGGRIIKCLQANMSQVSDVCKQALVAVQASQQQ